MRWKLFLGIILLILVVIFTLQNTEVIALNFLAWQFSISRALLLFLVLAIGIIVGWATSTLSERRHARKHAFEDHTRPSAANRGSIDGSEPQ